MDCFTLRVRNDVFDCLFVIASVTKWSEAIQKKEKNEKRRMCVYNGKST
jgi:hypothetical protein